MTVDGAWFGNYIILYIYILVLYYLLPDSLYSLTQQPNSALNNQLTNSVALACELTILTERPPLVGEVSANFLCIQMCRMVSVADHLRP
jgi:hypothetical protein